MSERLKKYQDILKKYWGYDALRPTQEEIILSFSAGMDTLGLMPTGGGKSLTFQIPALAEDGLCLVVTPLIALMKDQVQSLRAKGIKAEAIHSGMRRNNMVILLDNAALGGVKFLYVSPERLSTQLFLDKLPHLNVKWLVVDEAHCISQWGYDFRPSYLKIADIRDHLPGVPVLALTATATPQVVSDMQQRLHFEKENCIRMSFERTNVVYYVRPTEDKIKALLTVLCKMRGSAIVYVRNRKKTQEVSEYLVSVGISSTFYHAGLATGEKEKKQDAWMKGDVRVIVATNAFGMGIDKPDVRIVVHLDLPDSVEAYFQEAGRAGRDGKKAFAILLYNKTDDRKLNKQFADSYPAKEFIKLVYQKLCNYFQVAVGSGLNRHFDFDLVQFCKVYKLSRVQTHYALKILHNAGYIFMNDQADATSRLHVFAQKDDLFRFQDENEKHEDLIKLILRTYSGLFSTFVYINEKFLATRSGMSQQQVYETLVGLDKFKMVKYIPGKKLPQIVFKRERVADDMVAVSKDVYDLLKNRYRQRIQYALAYASRSQICRSVDLLNYFGEKGARPCGNCDVCRQHLSDSITDREFDVISSEVRAALEKKSMSLSCLVDQLKHPESKVLLVVRWLVDNGTLLYDDNALLSIHVQQ